MGLSVLHLVEASLLVANGLAILDERRLLRKYGLAEPAFNQSGPRNQAATFLFMMRNYMRLPLVGVNVLVILLELLIG
jgi:hypothetical protein